MFRKQRMVSDLDRVFIRPGRWCVSLIFGLRMCTIACSTAQPAPNGSEERIASPAGFSRSHATCASSVLTYLNRRAAVS